MRGLRPGLQILNRYPLSPLGDRLGIDSQLTAQRRERSLRSLYCCSDGVRGRGAPMTYLSHAASFHSNERIAPSNRGIKHLGSAPVPPRPIQERHRSSPMWLLRHPGPVAGSTGPQTYRCRLRQIPAPTGGAAVAIQDGSADAAAMSDPAWSISRQVEACCRSPVSETTPTPPPGGQAINRGYATLAAATFGLSQRTI